MTTANYKKLIPVLIAVAVIYYSADDSSVFVDSSTPNRPTEESRQTAGLVDGAQAQGSGVVTRILSDDNDGSRHQRFILRLPSGQTLLVAHNIDLAARVARIQVGDTVEFNGEFETNPQGGVIHWTHHDPQGIHIDGWLRHKGQTYQ